MPEIWQKKIIEYILFSYYMIANKNILFLHDQCAKVAQLVEHDLPKVGVAGSSPVFRSEILQYAHVA